MFNTLFAILDEVKNTLWGYPGMLLIAFIGIYLTTNSSVVQLRRFPAVLRIFFHFLRGGSQENVGIHPLKAFFAAIGGAIGLGNIVVITAAVQIGGPGALFWLWITAFFGTVVKYSEVYLGLRFRVRNNSGGYDGGPMYFLRHAFKVSWVPTLICILLCLYGVEVFQFNAVTESISVNWDVNRYVVIVVLLILVLAAGAGGVKRVGEISSALIPLFVITYLAMGIWVVINNLSILPSLFNTVITSAFTGHAAIGGFAGSTMMMALAQGAAGGAYSGDIGIGYSSIMHSESSVTQPEKQASLAIFGIFLDTVVVCTVSMMIVLSTGVWQLPIEPGLLIQTALSQYFPYMNLFMPFFIFLLGYTTLTAYFCMGIKCAQYLAPKYGRKIYFVYAVLILVLFSFANPKQALILMQLSGGLLLVINLIGIFRLRREISFDIPKN